MGKWEDDKGTETAVANKYLKLEIGKTKLRVLDEGPAKKWVHWAGSKPYTCSERGCPACTAFFDVRATDPDGAKVYSRRRSYLVNALAYGSPPEVKVLAFGNELAKLFAGFDELYGDLRDYDVIIEKSKTGPLPQNVSYQLYYGGTKAALSTEYQAIAEDRHDLSEEVKPADPATIIAAFGLGAPDGEHVPGIASPGEVDELFKKVRAIDPKLELEDFGIDPYNATKEQIATVNAQLAKK